MRVAAMMNWITGYQDTCFRTLRELGDDVLLIHPSSYEHAPFDRSRFATSIDRYVWPTDAQPSAEELVPLVDEFEPDVVIMWSWAGRGYRSVMRSQRGKALRVMFTSNWWHGSLRQRVGVAVSPVYVRPLADAAWVPGERSEQFARRMGFAGSDIIRGANAADTRLFDRGRRDGGELATRGRFLFTGRLIWHKAPVELAQAYRLYRDSVPEPWGLDIVGEGPLASVFDGIPGVRLHGFRQPDELSAIMHESSALILPSHIEWYGVVVHEAAAAGLPLIVSDGVGAVPHLLQDGFNGWTFGAGDVQGMARAMRRMSNASPDRLGDMSDGSRALGSRLTPEIWARNLHEELEARISPSPIRTDLPLAV